MRPDWAWMMSNQSSQLDCFIDIQLVRFFHKFLLIPYCQCHVPLWFAFVRWILVNTCLEICYRRTFQRRCTLPSDTAIVLHRLGGGGVNISLDAASRLFVAFIRPSKMGWECLLIRWVLRSIVQPRQERLSPHWRVGHHLSSSRATQ